MVASITFEENTRIETPAGWDDSFSGYVFRFTADQQPLKVFIDDFSCCCEDWGIFMVTSSARLCGKTLTAVAWTADFDVNLAVADLSTVPTRSTMAVTKDYETFKRYYKSKQETLSQKATSDDLFSAILDMSFSDGNRAQIVVFNHHNGYYSHSVYTELKGRKDYQNL